MKFLASWGGAECSTNLISSSLLHSIISKSEGGIQRKDVKIHWRESRWIHSRSSTWARFRVDCSKSLLPEWYDGIKTAGSFGYVCSRHWIRQTKINKTWWFCFIKNLGTWKVKYFDRKVMTSALIMDKAAWKTLSIAGWVNIITGLCLFVEATCRITSS